MKKETIYAKNHQLWLVVLLFMFSTAIYPQTLVESEGSIATIEITGSFDKVTKTLVNNQIKAKTDSKITVVTNNTFEYDVIYESSEYMLYSYCVDTPNKTPVELFKSTRVKDIRNYLIEYILAE